VRRWRFFAGQHIARAEPTYAAQSCAQAKIMRQVRRAKVRMCCAISLKQTVSARELLRYIQEICHPADFDNRRFAVGPVAMMVKI